MKEIFCEDMIAGHNEDGIFPGSDHAFDEAMVEPMAKVTRNRSPHFNAYEGKHLFFPRLEDPRAKWNRANAFQTARGSGLNASLFCFFCILWWFERNR